MNSRKKYLKAVLVSMAIVLIYGLPASAGDLYNVEEPISLDEPLNSAVHFVPSLIRPMNNVSMTSTLIRFDWEDLEAHTGKKIVYWLQIADMPDFQPGTIITDMMVENSHQIMILPRNGVFYWRVGRYHAVHGWLFSMPRRIEVGRIHGDINGDDVTDLVIGCISENTLDGQVKLFFGPFESYLLPNLIIHTPPDALGGRFGRTAKMIGDVNGDGYTDVAICADMTGPGRLYLYYGGPSMDSTADIIYTGSDVGEHFGYSVSGVGDVNDDGFDDFIVGAPLSAKRKGAAFLFYGGRVPSLEPDLFFVGTDKSQFGISVSGGWDINGDAYPDFVIGAPSDGDDYEGTVNVYFGGPELDFEPNYVLYGDAGSGTGDSVTCEGDFNNDGYADILVGAPTHNGSIGRAYIWNGGETLNQDYDHIIYSPYDEPSRFGNDVQFVSDLNEDGYTEALVGANTYTTFESEVGRAVLYRGKETNTRVLLPARGLGPTIGMGGPNFAFGTSITSLGDINNDGRDDFAVSAPKFRMMNGLGCVYIYHGKPLGQQNDPDKLIINYDSSFLMGSSISSLP